MKNLTKLKLQTLLLLMLAFGFSSGAYASEVTGTLRSGGGNNNPPPAQEEEELSGAVVPPTDNASGASSSSSSRNASGGSTNSSSAQNQAVLGASTYAAPPSTSNSPAANSRTATSGGDLAETVDENEEFEVAQLPESVESINDFVPTLSPAEEEGLGSWFWIILLSIVLVGGLLYYYLRPTDDWQRI